MADDHELDKLLNEALASYVDAEPDDALKTRVLSCVTDNVTRRRRSAAALSIFLAVAACMIAIVLLARSFKVEQSSSAPILSSAVRSATLPSRIPVPQNRERLAPARQRKVLSVVNHSVRRSSSQSAAPKSAVFPIPSPLSPEEKALLTLVASHPEQARQVLVPPASGTLESAPVTIAPIRIAALSDSPETPSAVSRFRKEE